MTKFTIRPHRFGRDIDNFFNDFLSNANLETKSDDHSPKVNISENDENIALKFEVPGMEKDQIKILIKDGLLTVSGDRKNEFEENADNCVRQEISSGSFNRSFNLPDTVDSGKVEANYKNGILELTLTKKEEAKPKEVEISIA